MDELKINKLGDRIEMIMLIRKEDGSVSILENGLEPDKVGRLLDDAATEWFGGD